MTSVGPIKILFVALSSFFFYSLDIDDCNPYPCVNNGTCIDGVDNYTCACVPGFQGKNCAISKYFLWRYLKSGCFNFSLNF